MKKKEQKPEYWNLVNIRRNRMNDAKQEATQLGCIIKAILPASNGVRYES